MTVELPPWTIWRTDVSSVSPSSTYKCTRTRCKTCPLISNMGKISGPNRSVKITDHLTCISVSVICCIIITCALCKKIYMRERGRRLADRFRKHLRDVEKTTQMRQSQLRAILIFLISSITTWESRKSLEQKFIFQLGTFSSRKRWTPLIPLIKHQIHVTIFPSMAKLLHSKLTLCLTSFPKIRF